MTGANDDDEIRNEARREKAASLISGEIRRRNRNRLEQALAEWRGDGSTADPAAPAAPAGERESGGTDAAVPEDGDGDGAGEA